jgi:hypothetical protein
LNCEYTRKDLASSIGYHLSQILRFYVLFQLSSFCAFAPKANEAHLPIQAAWMALIMTVITIIQSDAFGISAALCQVVGVPGEADGCGDAALLRPVPHPAPQVDGWMPGPGDWEPKWLFVEERERNEAFECTHKAY